MKSWSLDASCSYMIMLRALLFSLTPVNTMFKIWNCKILFVIKEWFLDCCFSSVISIFVKFWCQLVIEDSLFIALAGYNIRKVGEKLKVKLPICCNYSMIMIQNRIATLKKSCIRFFSCWKIDSLYTVVHFECYGLTFGYLKGLMITIYLFKLSELTFQDSIFII